MTYTTNQYLKLDIPLEEIAKIEIKTDEKNRMISDIEINDYEPNIIIAVGIDDMIDYCNIYSSVRILITDYDTIMGKIGEIPEFIEVIIVDNMICYDKNEENSDKDFDLLNFEDDYYNYGMKLERLIERGKINSSNKMGDTILMYLICNKKEEKAIKLIDDMEIEIINKVNNYGYTALMYACMHKMELLVLKMLEIEEINMYYVSKIHTLNGVGYTALEYAIKNNMELVALKMLESEEIYIKRERLNKCLSWDIANESGINSIINIIYELNWKKLT